MTSDLSNLPLSEQYYRAAIEWTDLENAASILEESKSAVLSQYMIVMFKTDPNISVAKAEMVSKGSPQWAEYIEKMVKARTAANKAKITMEFLKMKHWEANSREATERTQARF